MFLRITAFFVAALPILATANALEVRSGCNTGPIQCCGALQAANSTDVAEVLASEGLPVSIATIIEDIDGLVGVACLPLALVTASGDSCSTQPVCCTSNFFSGLIQAGCVPVNADA
ncbi:hypothetical protein CVT26_013197 [Gymnopilus dilepis]|uniref:Hydrophobin n=1 Tax=Gymnopilus dilepis TaxID=231916 RepID=A0A409VWI7_9AGAR|nr:hypothetical protein CVT26_013197 [Gymnopilus dilepis]